VKKKIGACIPSLSQYPLLVVVSGPSGVGKDATLAKMKETGIPLYYAITATTRPMRPGEKNDIDYHFLSEEQFQQLVKAKQFLEWAKVYGNYYGVLKKEINEALDKGKDVIVKVDVQGATTIKRIAPDAVFIFLMPPSMQELIHRLERRHGKLDDDLNSRLSKAQEEIEALPLFDYVVVTHKDKLDVTATEIGSIITSEKCRVQPRMIILS
jgi:guanylate kinase